MKQMYHGRHHRKLHALTAVLLLTAIFLTASGTRSPLTLADYNHNAHGVVNYCTISNGTTYIHGWAHDPDAGNTDNPTVTVTVGTQVKTGKTDISGYHDSTINKYLQANWPGAPTGSVYGYSIGFTGLYKGTAYNVSVTSNNVGAGESNVNRKDSVSTDWDGIRVNNLLNDNGTLPDACLNTRPVTPPPPTPTPTPTPSPSPSPSPSPKPGGGTAGGNSSGSSSSGSSSSGNATSPADGSVAAGTLSAVITVPSDGASSAYILYGTSPDNLDSSSDDGDLSSGNGSFELDGLQPKSDYFYQIVRTDSTGHTGTSSTAGFKTSGYTITLHFTDNDGQAVSGVEGTLDDADQSSAKSNKSGDMVFGNLDAGQYTVNFKYGKLFYKQTFDTDSAGDGSDNPGKTVELKNTVNVDKLSGGSTTGPTKKHSIWGTVLLILFLIAVIVGAVFWWLRRRSQALYGSAYGPAASYAGVTPDIVDKPTPTVTPVPKTKKSAPPPEHLEHVGESLRDMVIQSMHEEAQKRKNNQ